MSTSLRYTSADLEGLPDIDGVRYEIIDGELHVSKQPTLEHQFACAIITRVLGNWSESGESGVVLVAPGLVFAGDEDVAPDVVWISHERLAHGIDESRHLRVAPELVVEVLSPGARNEARDRELKLKLYSRQGVHEYWIVDCRGKTVQIYRRERAALELVATLDDADELTSPLLPGFGCSLQALWYAQR
jgi:Uma2 family endonuclease